MLHLLQVVKHHRKGIRVQQVKCQRITRTLHNTARNRRCHLRLTLLHTNVHILSTCVLQYLQREVIVYRSHRSTKHTLMHLIILASLLHKIHLLQPVTNLLQPRVQKILNRSHIIFRHTHLAQLHAAVSHLVHHVDVKQVTLGQFKPPHLAIVPHTHRSLRQLTLKRKQVCPSLTLAKHLSSLRVKLGSSIAITRILILCRSQPTTHVPVPQVTLALHILAAKHTQHLVKRTKRGKQQLHWRAVQHLVHSSFLSV